MDESKAVRLELKKDPADKQAPEIKLRIKAFSRPVLRFQVKLRNDQTPTEVFVTHLKSKLPTRSTRNPWLSMIPTRTSRIRRLWAPGSRQSGEPLRRSRYA